jgi:outer membrane protein assembly factor BamB
VAVKTDGSGDVTESHARWEMSQGVPDITSPVTDGRRFYALFANGLLAAFDFEGERVWAIGLGAPDNAYGHATSLITHGETLLVQWDQGYDDDDLSSLIAFDGPTGEKLWTKPRAVCATWASPIIANTAGRDQLITFAEPHAIAYDPATGDELWRFEGPAGDVAPGPVVTGDTMLMAIPWDRLVAVKTDGSGDVTESHARWEMSQGVPDITSPVTDGGAYVYMAETEGIFTAVNLENGEVVWEHQFEAQFHASPTIIGDKVYLTSLEGVTYVLKTGGTFEQLAEYPLGEGVVASMAVINGRIYLRGEKNLFCIGEVSP